MYALNTVAPIFLLVLLGWALRRTGFLDRPFFAGLNRLVFWVGLPILFFNKIATAPAGATRAGTIFLVLLGGTAAGALLGLLVARLFRLDARSTATLIQGAFRGNLGYVGLPVILYSVAGWQPQARSAAEGLAVLAIAPLVPVYNVAAVLILLGGSTKRTEIRVGRFILKALTNPLVIGCAAGFVFWIPWLRLPLVLDRTTAAVGQMVLPMALLALGASLQGTQLTAGLVPAAAGAFVKICCVPLVGFALARLAGLGALETRIALVYLACPTAVVSHIMAQQFGSDGPLAARIILISTLLCGGVLSLALSSV